MPMPPNMGDHLIEAARQGDEAAWRALYEDVAPAVRGYLRARRVNDPEDLLGTVLFEAARGIDSFQGNRHQFRAWVFTIAHRRWIDELRAGKHRPSLPSWEAPEPAAVDDTESAAIASLESERLLSFVDALPPAQRTVVLLRVLGDLTHADIARAVGSSKVAVKVNYHRGIRALRAALGGSREAAIGKLPDPGHVTSRDPPTIGEV